MIVQRLECAADGDDYYYPFKLLRVSEKLELFHIRGSHHWPVHVIRLCLFASACDMTSSTF